MTIDDQSDARGPVARSRLVALVLLCASTLTVMDGGLVAPALPAMERYFAGTGNVELLTRLVATLPSLSIAVCALLAGSLVDRTGRKPVLVVSIVLFVLGGASGLLLDNLYAILGGRVLLGLGLAGVMTSATTLIADYYSGEQRSRMFGLQTAFMGLGAAVFSVLGGIVAEINWRAPFAAYLLAILLVPPAVLRLVEPAIEKRRSIAESAGGERERLPADVVRALILLVVLAVLGMVVFYVVLAQLPFYFEEEFDIGAAGSGMALGLFALFQLFAGVLYSRISARFGIVAVTVGSFVLLALGYALVGLGGLVVVSIGLCLAGAGGGLLIPSLTTWGSALSPEADRGRILGGLMGAVFFGQFLSPVVAYPLAVVSSYGTAFVAAAGLAGMLALLTTAVTRTIPLSHDRTGRDVSSS